MRIRYWSSDVCSSDLSSSGIARRPSLANQERERRISAIPTPLVSRPRPGISQKKDVQTETYVALRDAAFILFPFSSFLPTFRAQKRGSDAAEPTPPPPLNATPLSAPGASPPAQAPPTETPAPHQPLC